MWGDNDVSVPLPSLAYCLSSGWMWAWEPWWWYRLEITPDLSTRALWQSHKQRRLERVWGMDEGMRILCIQYLWCVNESFTCYKILRNGTCGFTSHPKEGVLRYCIALKIPSPSAGFEPATLGSSGKHTNHYTTEATASNVKHMYMSRPGDQLFWLRFYC
jgi:hypothetical protein